ncbi:FadR/GntR family transcriptional regulator [Neptuniibacter halophilus]|uniref:FadR/GntR family transcriptional regulator n=1 Tax=Neptuniibacter halophilus TaxID=651666 RepID=UPI0025726706|nr:FadR/GntR family transcriptional regulator [Neptuniibacter halophilus]
MSLELEPINRSSLSKQVADQLQEAILEGSLKADDRLPTEDELAKRFQVSRPTIREALKRLAAKNLIRSRRGPSGGTFVNHLGADELSDQLTTAATLFVSMNQIEMDDLSRARYELEAICADLACAQRTDEDLQKMQQALATQLDSGISPEQFCAADVELHRALADASHNPMLSFIMYTQIEALQPVANMITYRFRQREVIIDQHQRLLQAIEQRDSQTARAILKEQIDYLNQLQLAVQNNRNTSTS